MPEDLTNKEKLALIGAVIEISINVINNNHCYQFENKIYCQKKGGPTGLRITGLLARIHMDNWMIKMSSLMEDNLVHKYFVEKYVDDVNMALENIGLGVRWTTSTPSNKSTCQYKKVKLYEIVRMKRLKKRKEKQPKMKTKNKRE